MSAVSEAGALSAAACLFHGFSDRSRLAIVQHLLRGEHRVVDLTGHLALAQSTVSKHLSCLVDCGIAQVRAQGRASMYSLAHPDATLELLSAAETLLALTGDAVPHLRHTHHEGRSMTAHVHVRPKPLTPSRAGAVGAPGAATCGHICGLQRPRVVLQQAQRLAPISNGPPSAGL